MSVLMRPHLQQCAIGTFATQMSPSCWQFVAIWPHRSECPLYSSPMRLCLPKLAGHQQTNRWRTWWPQIRRTAEPMNTMFGLFNFLKDFLVKNATKISKRKNYPPSRRHICATGEWLARHLLYPKRSTFSPRPPPS